VPDSSEYPEKSGRIKTLLAIVATGGHPLTPFVVSEKRNSNNEDGENADKNLHGVYRIA